MELFDLIKPHYDSINKTIENIKCTKEKKTISVLIDGFPYLHSIKLQEKIDSKVNIECKTSNDIYNDLINKNYSLIISPLDIHFDNKEVLKISLEREKIGIIAHKDICVDTYKANTIMNNHTLIHTASSLEHIVMKRLIKSMASNGINIQSIATNEIGLLYMLKDKVGYSIISECFFLKNSDIMKDLIFMVEPFNLSLNRKAYLLKENIHLFDLDLLRNSQSSNNHAK